MNVVVAAENLHRIKDRRLETPSAGEDAVVVVVVAVVDVDERKRDDYDETDEGAVVDVVDVDYRDEIATKKCR